MLLRRVWDNILNFSFSTTNVIISESIGAVIPTLNKQSNDIPGADSYLGSITRQPGSGRPEEHIFPASRPLSIGEEANRQ